MKTEAQLARTENELRAVSNSVDKANYFVRPYHKGPAAYNHPWREYLAILEGKLCEELAKL